MITLTRPVHVTPGSLMGHGGDPRPLAGGAPAITRPLPQSIPGQQPFAGMDPSNPSTWVRPFNPQPGMVARLNFNGAAAQGDTEMGGLWGAPASRITEAAARPRRAAR